MHFTTWQAAEKKGMNVLKWIMTDKENFVFEQMRFSLPGKAL